MIRKTDGIVLRAQAFGESSLIVTLYTREHGRVAAIAKGVRTAKGSRKHALFQVGMVLSVVYYDKPSRELQHLTESALAVSFRELHIRPVKILYNLLICEIFSNCVREHQPNLEAFELLRQTLIDLDAIQEGHYNLLILFLLNLMVRLGCQPCSEVQFAELPILFDLNEGRLQNSPGTDSEVARLLFQYISWPHAHAIGMNPKPAARQRLLNLLIDFLTLHIPDFRRPRTLEVFQDVYSA